MRALLGRMNVANAAHQPAQPVQQPPVVQYPVKQNQQNNFQPFMQQGQYPMQFYPQQPYVHFNPFPNYGNYGGHGSGRGGNCGRGRSGRGNQRELK